MPPKDRVRLLHMRDAARAAISFCEGMTQGQFAVDDLTVSAVTKKVEIIGEAAFKCDSQTLAEIPGIPWPKVIGMRHFLVHTYYDINIDLLWKTVHEDLPLLLDMLEKHLQDD